MTQKKINNNKRIIPIVLGLLAILVALLLAVNLINSSRKPAWQGGYSIHISEVMTKNTTCPDSEGVLCDWVEIENTSGRDFDLSNYYLTDTAGEGKYAFPSGSCVPAHGFLLVGCDPRQGKDNYAPFAFRAEGGETVAILNSNHVAVDSCTTVECEQTQSLVRAADGSLQPCDTPTPGFSNDEAGAAAWAETLASRSGGELRLSEIMASNTLYMASDGGYYDWVEVYNPSDKPVALAGYKLTDREGEMRYALPEDRTLQPGEYLVVWCRTGGTGELTAPFALRRAGGESLYLFSPANTACDSIELPALEKNVSYAFTGSGWEYSKKPTPGYPNTEEGYAAYVAAGGYGDCLLQISELMTGNKTTVRDSYGDYSDWIELYNAGTEAVPLKGWYLSDKEELLTEWALPDVTLQSGEYLLVFASGRNSAEGEIHTSFSLSAGETVFLTTPAGTVLASVDTTGLENDRSVVRKEDGGYRVSGFATPGFSNDGEGYEQLCAKAECDSEIQINEVSVSGGDWVELKNTSSADVALDGLFLTDSLTNTEPFALSGTVPSGGLQKIEGLSFGLNSQNDEIFLLDASGSVLDCAGLHGIPAGGSYGRMNGRNGFFYFLTATPGAENGEGFRRVTETPTADVPAGIYENTDALTVTLSGEGEIRYTTDGSTPTKDSPLYSAPLSLTKTTVLRAACFESGAIPGQDLVLGYYLNENATLPIVSLVTDSGNLFGGNGIYDSHELAWQQKWEREASLSMYELAGEGEGFTIDCGIRIHGRTSRRVSEKRSFTIKFRGKYGGDLNYDVFGDGKITEFSTLLLRTTVGNNYNTYLRDELFARLAMDYTEVPAQNYRYVSLYLNGEYWGIYAIREHHDEDYFASHFGVDAATVDMQTGEFINPGAWSDLLDYAQTHALNTDESWQYMQEHLDVEKMIDWLILECYGGDTDIYENVRFYASPEYENGRYVYAITDMDLTMQSHDTMYIGFDMTSPAGIIPVMIRGNAQFRDLFCTRLGELLNGGLSAQSVSAALDSIDETISGEVDRDTQRWGVSRDTYETGIDRLQSYIAGRKDEMINGATGFFGLTPEEAAAYFG